MKRETHHLGQPLLAFSHDAWPVGQRMQAPPEGAIGCCIVLRAIVKVAGIWRGAREVEPRRR